MFHAASNGRTESAQNFSGAQIAYLTTVSTPEEYTETQTFTIAQFNEQLKAAYSLAQIAQAQITRNDTNRVERITIGQKTWTGREFRELLRLKSTDFIINVNSEIEIQTKGYGHGVGMSQYGANELASNGRTAQEILAHYLKSPKCVNASTRGDKLCERTNKILLRKCGSTSLGFGQLSMQSLQLL